MPGLGPDMSALNLLSQANLSSVLNKVKKKAKEKCYTRCNNLFILVDIWEEAVDTGAGIDETSGQNC